MDDYETVLRQEFSAEEGSFLLRLRCEREWDREAFSRLVLAMEHCAADQAERSQIERWIANGFWYLERFVPTWSSHPHFPRLYDEGYYQAAYQRLGDLAFWFFFGERPYQGDGPLSPL